MPELLRLRAQELGPKQAHIELAGGRPARSMSYADWDRRARAIGARLRRVGPAGARALLVYPSGLDFIEAFCGALFGGWVPVPAYLPHPFFLKRTLPRLRAIAKDCAPRVGLTTSSCWGVLKGLCSQAPELEQMRWIVTDQVDSSAAAEWTAPPIAPEDVAVIQYTSGTLTDPKGVMLTHRNILSNAKLIHDLSGHTPDTRVVLWLPHSHDMGLMSIVQMLYAGCLGIDLPTVEFLKDPFLWLEAISLYRGTSSPAPGFAYDQCVSRVAADRRAALDLSSWEMAYIGAEPVNAKTLERFLDVFGPCGFRPEAFYPCYGLAENTLIASGGSRFLPPVLETVARGGLERGWAAAPQGGERSATLVGCGESLPDQRLEIVNPDDRTRCPSQRIGEIWISGPSVAKGYWDRPEQTKSVFQARLADTKEGPFLRTGDLGFLKEGELFITGRLKEVIIINGGNHHPEDLEQAARESHPEIRQNGCAAFPVEREGKEEVVIVVEMKGPGRRGAAAAGGADEIRQAVRNALWSHHLIHAGDIVVVRHGKIPKTASGKIQREQCRSDFIQGRLERAI